MRRFVPLLACVMLLLTLWTGMAAHAAESLLPVTQSADMGWDHAPGDADEVPADADKAVPHHHGPCHGHDASIPLEFGVATRMAAAGLRGILPVRVLGATLTDTALRPPND